MLATWRKPMIARMLLGSDRRLVAFILIAAAPEEAAETFAADIIEAV